MINRAVETTVAEQTGVHLGEKTFPGNRSLIDHYIELNFADFGFESHDDGFGRNSTNESG